MADQAELQSLKPRTVPMEVLVLGLCRTGTKSMQVALQQLGYQGVYHMATVLQHREHIPLWNAALEAQFEGKGKEYGIEEWDNLLGDYQALTDIPSSLFVASLIKTYPSARIILTTRSPASWYNSMQTTVASTRPNSTLGSRLKTHLLTLLSHLHLHTLPAPTAGTHLFDLIFAHYFPHFHNKDAGIAAFNRHNQLVRDTVVQEGAEERFLEFHASQGWGPLCAFLNKEVPGEPFPNVNDIQTFRRAFGLDEKERWERVWVVVGGVGVGALVGLVAWGMGRFGA